MCMYVILMCEIIVIIILLIIIILLLIMNRNINDINNNVKIILM